MVYLYIYLHLPYKSTIHVGEYTVRPMDPSWEINWHQFFRWCSRGARCAFRLGPSKGGNLWLLRSLGSKNSPRKMNGWNPLNGGWMGWTMIFRISIGWFLGSKWLFSRGVNREHRHSKIPSHFKVLFFGDGGELLVFPMWHPGFFLGNILDRRIGNSVLLYFGFILQVPLIIPNWDSSTLSC